MPAIDQKTLEQKRAEMIAQQNKLLATRAAAEQARVAALETIASCNRDLDHVAGALQMLAQLDRDLNPPKK